SKLKNCLEPTLVLFTAEKAIRFCALMSATRERRNSDCQTCQLPMTLCTPRPQSSKRPYHTQMSMEFQLTVCTPVSQRRNRQRSTSFSACPLVAGPPKTRPALASRKMRSLVSLYVEKAGPYSSAMPARPAPSRVTRAILEYQASHWNIVPPSGPSHRSMVLAG